MKKIRAGIIGLGEVAQIIHLPVLETLKDKYEISALCDISQNLLNIMGEKYQVKQLYTDSHDLIKQKDLDAVFILNSDAYHAECAVRAAKNGKSVFMEKPMCLSCTEADEIIKARDESGVEVMVGYMRRFAPAFLKAVEEVKKIEKINYVRIRDIIGQNSFFIENTSSVYRFNDFPEEIIKKRIDRTYKTINEAIGDVPERLIHTYMMLCGLSSHDISALREIAGIPNRVAAAYQRKESFFLNVIFEYDSFYAFLETGIDNLMRFDAHIEIYGNDKSVKVQYNTPYIRHLPVTVSIQKMVDNAYSETVILPSYKDPFTAEIEHFYDIVVNGVKLKTPPEDAKADLVIFKMIIEALSKNM